MKDNFSSDSDQYAKYRPVYPEALFQFLDGAVARKQAAWDCGTGNGQVAVRLAEAYAQVFATDISQAQLDHAAPRPNIHYSLQPAEKADFPDACFDLIVVAQAIHWFDFERFYAEVRRTARADAVLCVVGYGKLVVDAQVDALIADFYHGVIGPYWDRERRYIDEEYRTIPFPFAVIAVPAMAHAQEWTLEHLIGYLNTWSAVKHFTKANGHNPVEALAPRLAAAWGAVARRQIQFPLLLRMGRVHG